MPRLLDRLLNSGVHASSSLVCSSVHVLVHCAAWYTKQACYMRWVCVQYAHLEALQTDISIRIEADAYQECKGECNKGFCHLTI